MAVGSTHPTLPSWLTMRFEAMEAEQERVKVELRKMEVKIQALQAERADFRDE